MINLAIALNKASPVLPEQQCTAQQRIHGRAHDIRFPRHGRNISRARPEDPRAIPARARSERRGRTDGTQRRGAATRCSPAHEVNPQKVERLSTSEGCFYWSLARFTNSTCLYMARWHRKASRLAHPFNSFGWSRHKPWAMKHTHLRHSKDDNDKPVQQNTAGPKQNAVACAFALYPFSLFVLNEPTQTRRYPARSLPLASLVPGA